MAFELPGEIERQFAGRWIAWDMNTNQFLGHGCTIEEVDRISNPALRAGHMVHTQYIWPKEVIDRRQHWKSLPESNDPGWETQLPRDVERQYVGKVIAWDLVTKQVAGYGATIDEASDAAEGAKQAGHPLYYHYIFPPNALLLGGLDLAFFDNADRRLEAPDHSRSDSGTERNVGSG